MTVLLYQTDSYLKSFQAEVTAVNTDQHGVALNQTAFYTLALLRLLAISNSTARASTVLKSSSMA